MIILQDIGYRTRSLVHDKDFRGINVGDDLLNLIGIRLDFTEGFTLQSHLIYCSLIKYFYKTIIDFHMNKLEDTLMKLLSLFVIT